MADHEHVDTHVDEDGNATSKHMSHEHDDGQNPHTHGAEDEGADIGESLANVWE